MGKDLKPGSELSYKFLQATIEQGTGKPIQVKHNGKTFEGTPHEDGVLFSDINTRNVKRVK